jgi:oxalate decarboxylase/phosphoglucose isomerase-like protein (cupin superfamily)
MIDFFITNDRKEPELPPPQYQPPVSPFFKPKVVEKVQTQQEKQEIPKGLRTFSNGSAFKPNEKDTDEWLLYSPKTSYVRSKDLNQNDIQEIVAKRLKLSVAIIIKNLWASGASIGQLYKLKRGEAHFSKRNIEKYYAIFNRNNPSRK